MYHIKEGSNFLLSGKGYSSSLKKNIPVSTIHFGLLTPQVRMQTSLRCFALFLSKFHINVHLRFILSLNGSGCKLCLIISEEQKALILTFFKRVSSSSSKCSLVPRDVASQLGLIFEKWLVCFEQTTLPWFIFDIYKEKNGGEM